ncbi:MAG: hypothetical protein GXP45_03010 [bacterium]|nr:hypothetical protein [bacterium]
MIQGTLEKTIRSFIPPKEIRVKMIAKVNETIAQNSQEKNIKLADNTRKIRDLQMKLTELTESYTDGII